MDDFDYKKYSLEKLETWLDDALCSADATPQEIYDTIRKVVSENYYHHKHHASRAYELMEKLNGSVTFTSCDKDDKSPERQKAWSEFWEEVYYPEEHQKHSKETKDDGMRPWGHSDLEYLANSTLTEDRISNFPEEQTTPPFVSEDGDVWNQDKIREYNLREAEYYNKRAELDVEYMKAKIQATSPYNDGWTQEHYQNIVDCIEQKQDKVTKWVLPVELDGLTGDCVVTLPDDLLERVGWVEGDTVEFVSNTNGSFTVKKVVKSVVENI